MKHAIKYTLFVAALTLVIPAQAEKIDRQQVYTNVKNNVSANPEMVLELVKKNVAKNQSCACEIVKAAIIASNADKNLVADIVEAAITSAPEKARLIGQCAVAVAPDALVEVQAMVVKYGVVSAKTASRDETSSYQDDDEGGNPLDFPGGDAGSTSEDGASAANTDASDTSDGDSNTGGNTGSGSSQGGGNSEVVSFVTGNGSVSGGGNSQPPTTTPQSATD
ncbi:MAG: hypothetical protein P8O22_10865 [Akkermansiaceae bacterium]|nr:hypothetical protein [Akkermansiaceae bacterium]